MRVRGLFGRVDERGLRLLCGGFFIALAVPAAVLVAQAYSQLKWEAFRSTQLAAEELVARIDADLRAAVAAEDARAYGDYSFLVVAGNAAANFVQRSPLAAFPVQSAVPGVLGYFQVDATGRLTTPLLPDEGVRAADYGISSDETAARAARVAEVRAVLVDNRLVRANEELPELASARVEVDASLRDQGAVQTNVAPLRRADLSSAAALSPAAPAVAAVEEAQAAFDRLAAGASVRAGAQSSVDAPGAVSDVEADEVRLNRPLSATAPAAALTERQKRLEQALEAETVAPPAETVGNSERELAVRTFASEIDPFEVGALQTAHLVLFRNVWREGQRYIQGALVEQAPFVAEVVETAHRASSLGAVSRLDVSFDGRALGSLPAIGASYRGAPGELAGTALYRSRLSPPFGALELAFNVDSLPRAPGATLLAWVALTLAVVLCGGFVALYRLALGQLKLARQQQDFVSAVSHELKTPLTSIRMYGEMLKAGWADETKKRVYYDYIHSESERLSRLIDNVLELARLTRNTRHFDLQPTTVAELLDTVRSKVATQVERAGFELRVRNDAPAAAEVVVDADAFAQIFINLVDNALKFAAGSETKAVEIACRGESDGGTLFTVRDFGPGVPKAHMRKIFELFYRPENELTRETVGTGIGLALVRQLAAAMGARVDVRNVEPGAEFRLHYPPRRAA